MQLFGDERCHHPGAQLCEMDFSIKCFEKYVLKRARESHCDKYIYKVVGFQMILKLVPKGS